MISLRRNIPRYAHINCKREATVPVCSKSISHGVMQCTTKCDYAMQFGLSRRAFDSSAMCACDYAIAEQLTWNESFESRLCRTRWFAFLLYIENGFYGVRRIYANFVVRIYSGRIRRLPQYQQRRFIPEPDDELSRNIRFYKCFNARDVFIDLRDIYNSRGVYTCREVSAGVGDALLRVQHGEQLKRICGTRCEVPKCIGHRVDRNDAGLGISGVAEALRPQPETGVISLGRRRPIYDRGFPISHRHRQV